jgi:uroporphyrinogen-III synthase
MKAPCVLVIRNDERFASLLRQGGFEVISLQLISTESIEDSSEVDERIARIQEYDGLFFTSPKAASAFVEHINKNGRGFDGKVYCLGERSREILEKARFDVVISGANTAGEMINSFDDSEFVGKKFLFVRGNLSMRTIPELLAGKSSVDEVVVYRTIELSPSTAEIEKITGRLKAGEIDWICFFSPSGVESFKKVFADLGEDTKVAVIGQTTAGKAREFGMNVQYISPKSNSEDLAMGLIELKASRLNA